MKTHWTEERLRRLFTRYNRKFWNGRLKVHTVSIRNLGQKRLGQYSWAQSTISVNPELHANDREIRSTLLHEMAHAAAVPNSSYFERKRDAHGRLFWTRLGRVLQKGAPIVGWDRLQASWHIPRPKRVFDRQEVVRLRDVEGLSWEEIMRRTGRRLQTVVRAYRELGGRERLGAFPTVFEGRVYE